MEIQLRNNEDIVCKGITRIKFEQYLDKLQLLLFPILRIVLEISYIHHIALHEMKLNDMTLHHLTVRALH